MLRLSNHIPLACTVCSDSILQDKDFFSRAKGKDPDRVGSVDEKVVKRVRMF